MPTMPRRHQMRWTRLEVMIICLLWRWSGNDRIPGAETPWVIVAASIIERTPDAVGHAVGNFVHNDAEECDRAGFGHVGKVVRETTMILGVLGAFGGFNKERRTA